MKTDKVTPSEQQMPMISFSKYVKLYPECPERVPFTLLDEKQAQKNHMQSLSRLAERGGLCPSEMIAIINKREWQRCDEGEAINVINRHLAEHKQRIQPSESGERKSPDKLPMSEALKEIYASGLWREIEDNFQGFDELIEDEDLRDFYKRVIWELANSRTELAIQPLLERIGELEKDNAGLRSIITDLHTRACDIMYSSAVQPYISFAQYVQNTADIAQPPLKEKGE